jgi:hypothetical protein
MTKQTCPVLTTTAMIGSLHLNLILYHHSSFSSHALTLPLNICLCLSVASCYTPHSRVPTLVPTPMT